jgi:hypothetical protein
MHWIDVLIGALLLLFGRKLFWLFVGGVGFVVGFQIATDAMHNQPEWVIFLIALGSGLIGIVLSIFLQRVVVAIAGFFAGGYFLSSLIVELLHANQQVVQWVAFVVGGIIGAILTLYLFDPALIILSSLAGSTAVAQNVPLEPGAKGILFLVLLAMGIIVQSRQYFRDRKPPKQQANSSTQ